MEDASRKGVALALALAPMLDEPPRRDFGTGVAAVETEREALRILGACTGAAPPRRSESGSTDSETDEARVPP